MSGSLRRPLAVFLFFVLLTFIALSPLSYHLNSLVPTQYGGEWDYFHFHWNLWWVREAITHGQDPFYTNKVLAPFTHNLTYHSLTPSLEPFYMALEPIFGHLRAANMIMALLLALSGAVMVLFLRRQGVSPGTALIGGTVFAFCPYMLDHAASGHLNLLTTFWIPVGLMVWERTATTRRLRWAVLMGIVLWGMWLTDTLIILWGGLLLAPYALLTLVQARRSRLKLILLGLLAVILLLALAWIIGPLRQTLDFDTSQLPPARFLTLRYYSLSLKSLYWPKPAWNHLQGFEPDDTWGLILVVLAWAGLLVRKANRMRWFWLAAGLLPLLLALGPDEKILGVQVPLPFRIIHWLFDGQMRTPDRFFPPATLAIVTYVALTYDPWLQRIRRDQVRRVILAGALFLFIVDLGIFRPYPATHKLPSYQFYEMMGRENYDDYDYVVLEVPSGPYTGWRPLGSHPEAMYYGITHHKRMVSGLLSRIPIDEHLFYEHSALLAYLAGLRPLDADLGERELTRFVNEWPIGYVVVHQDWMDPDRAQETLDFLNSRPALCYLETEKDAVVYRTTSHPKACPPRLPPQSEPGVYRINLGARGDEGMIGHGWYGHENIGGVPARWAGRIGEAMLYFDLPTSMASGPDSTIRFHATAFSQARTVNVTAGDVIDGVPQGTFLGQITIQPGDWNDATVTLPADLIGRVQGHMILSLTADGLTSAADLGLSSDTRPLSLAYDWIEVQQGQP